MGCARSSRSGAVDLDTRSATRIPHRSQNLRLLALQRSAGNRAVAAILQRCRTKPVSDCARPESEEPSVGAVVQRQAEVLPWLWGAAQQGARAVGTGAAIGAGAIAAGLAAGAAVLLTSNTSIVSGQEEALMLATARLQGALRAATRLAAEIAVMAVLTPEAVDKIKGQVEGIITSVEGSIAGAGRLVMRCSNELITFREIAREIRDYLAQPVGQINKVRLARLMDRLMQAVAALAACMDSQASGG